MKKRILIYIICFTGISGYAQMRSSYYNQLEGWIGGGVASYTGEIGSKITTVQPSFNVGLRFFVSDHFAMNGQLLYAGLKGDDKIVNKTRGYSFNTPVGEIAANFEMYLFKEGSKFQRYSSYKGTGSKKINFYFSIGVGAIAFSPNATDGDNSGLSDELYEKSSYILPYGAGIRYTFDKDWSANIGVTNHITVTDYLDDYSKDSKKDAYMVAMVNVIYKMNKNRR